MKILFKLPPNDNIFHIFLLQSSLLIPNAVSERIQSIEKIYYKQWKVPNQPTPTDSNNFLPTNKAKMKRSSSSKVKIMTAISVVQKICFFFFLISTEFKITSLMHCKSHLMTIISTFFIADLKQLSNHCSSTWFHHFFTWNFRFQLWCHVSDFKALRRCRYTVE